MKLLPVLEMAEALGVPSLSFTSKGPAVATMGPEEAPAVMLMPGSVTDRGSITTTIPGPCLLKFSYTGNITVAPRVSGRSDGPGSVGAEGRATH
ncbi:MAG: hypothetical protein V4675_04240 [Verrucomicrobiota bacterium]